MIPPWWKHFFSRRERPWRCSHNLHYAPCSVGEQGFQVGIILPRGTNYPLEMTHEGWEDRLLAATNKWLIGHPEGGLPEGSHIGLIGENITV